VKFREQMELAEKLDEEFGEGRRKSSGLFGRSGVSVFDRLQAVCHLHEGSNAMRVVGYVRVSTEEQVSGGVSLAAQREKLTGYSTLYELELVEVVVDAGISAKSLHRPWLASGP